eukprot:scaffold167676_cov15-Tisochrysis_lutea.AAC.1
MPQAGVPDAVRMYVESPNVKTQDAAKGCLLQLGVLDDEAATQANQLGEIGRLYLENQSEHLSARLTAKTVLDSSDTGKTYDVFLSHKRTDAKDFAR